MTVADVEAQEAWLFAALQHTFHNMRARADAAKNYDMGMG